MGKKKTILTVLQQQTLAFVAKQPALSDFYLSGGTALAAYYLKHRHSEDLDFFSSKPVDNRNILTIVNNLKIELHAKDIRYERLHDRHIFFLQMPSEELKIEFTYYPFKQLGRLIKKDGLMIDSVRDITANKLAALLDRFEPKDFVDLYFLLQQYALKQVRKDAEKKFAIKIDPIFLGGELMKVQRIAVLPKMLKPLTIEQVQDFFINQSKILKSEVL